MMYSFWWRYVLGMIPVDAAASDEPHGPIRACGDGPDDIMRQAVQ